MGTDAPRERERPWEPATEQEWADLSERARAGDREAVGLMLAIIEPTIHLRMKPLVAAGCPRDDLYQDCVLDVLRGLQTWRPGAGSSWLTWGTMRVRAAIQWHGQKSGRARRLRAVPIDGTVDPPAPEPRDNRGAEATAAKLLSRLPRRQRSAVESWCGIGRDKLPRADIAKELGVSTKRVSQILRESLDKMKRHARAAGVTAEDIAA